MSQWLFRFLTTIAIAKMDRSEGTIINQDSSGTDGEGDRVGVGEELEVGVGDWVGRVFILAT